MSSLNAYGFWGPPEGIDTHDLLLYFEGANLTATPERLVGHTLTNPNIDQSDALNVTRVILSGGRIKVVVVTKRAPEERGRQYTIGFPSGAMWTPAMEAALRPGCRKTAYIRYLCPSDRKYNYSDILPDALFDPPQPAGDLITVDDVNPVSFTSVMRISQQFRIYELGYEIVLTDSTSDLVFSSVAFLTTDCPGCANIPGLDFVLGGGDGAVAAYSKKTDDRFGSVSAMTAGVPTTDYVTCWFNEGSLIVAGFADTSVVTASTAGGLKVSRDGGATWAAASGGPTVPVWGIAKLGDTLLAVGGTAAGAPILYKSSDQGKSWLAVVNATIIAGTAAFLSVAVDNEAGFAYIVGETGKLIKVSVSGASVVLTDISAQLPSAPGTLNSVCVFAKDYVAVGGAAGYYAESFDGGATDFTKFSVSGSVEIKRIAGNRWRSIVAAAGVLYDRSVLTEYEYAPITLENGQVVTGNYLDVAMRAGSVDDFNMFVAVTDAAEVVVGKSFLPNS